MNDGTSYYPLEHDKESLNHSVSNMIYLRPLQLNNDTFGDLIGTRSSGDDFQIITALNEGIV